MNTTDIINALVEHGVPFNDAVTLAAVGYAESGYQVGVEGDKDLGGSIGLFQIHLPAHGPKLVEWTGSQDRDTWIKWLSDPWNNIKAAAAVYKSQGLGAWTQYKNGAYKPYMGEILDVPGVTVSDGPLISGGEISSRSDSWITEQWLKVKKALGIANKPGDVPIDEEIAARLWAGLPTEYLKNAYKNSPAGQTGTGVIDGFSLSDFPKLFTGGLMVLAGVAAALVGFFLITRKEG